MASIWQSKPLTTIESIRLLSNTDADLAFPVDLRGTLAYLERGRGGCFIDIAPTGAFDGAWVELEGRVRPVRSEATTGFKHPADADFGVHQALQSLAHVALNDELDDRLVELIRHV